MAPEARASSMSISSTLGGDRFQGLPGGQALDLGDLLGLQGGEVGEVEAQPVLVHHAARLLHVGAQHLAQGRVQQVGGRVVGPDPAAADGMDQGVDRRVFQEEARHRDLVQVAPLGRGRAIQHLRMPALEAELARVAHLAAGLGVEGGAIQQDVALAGELLDPVVGRIEEGHHMGLALQMVRSP